MKNLLSILCYFMLTSTVIAQQSGKKKLTHLPDINIVDIKGVHTTLGAMAKGKITFIDNWFIPCPPCFREMGMLHQLYNKYGSNSQVNFITICATDPVIVKQFLAKDPAVDRYTKMYHDFSKLNYFKLPVYFIPGCNMKIFTGKQLKNYAPDDKTKCPDVTFMFSGYPTIVIFDKKGKLVFSETGYAMDENDEYKSRLEKILDATLAAN